MPMCRDSTSPPHKTATVVSDAAHREKVPPYTLHPCASCPTGPLQRLRTCLCLPLMAVQHVCRVLFLNPCGVLQGHQSPFTDLGPHGVLPLRAALAPLPLSLPHSVKSTPKPPDSPPRMHRQLAALRGEFSLSLLGCGGIKPGVRRTEAWRTITPFGLEAVLFSLSVGHPEVCL